jgi:hypothetical protein
MLEKCTAFTIGQDATQNRVVAKVAERAGFGTVLSVLDARPNRPVRVPFFLMHVDVPMPAKQAMLSNIRGSQDSEVRFAPVIVVAEDCPFETVLEHVEVGCDDVLVLPEKREIVVQRFMAQISGDHLYIQTPDYLGPDRRRMEMPGTYNVQRRGGGHQGHARLMVRRDVDTGTSVVRHDWVQ